MVIFIAIGIFLFSLMIKIYIIKTNNEINMKIKNISKKIDLKSKSEINEDELKLLENELEYKKRYAEMYFIRACRNVIDMNIESAKDNLELGKLEFYNTEYDSVKLYTDKLLTQIYVEDKDYEKAIEVAKEGFRYINEKSYNENYKEIWEIAAIVVETPGGRKLGINMLESMLDNGVNLSNEAKLNINRRLKGLYLTSDNYAKASESIIKSISLAEELDQPYVKAESMIELAVIFNRLNKEDYAINIINNVLIEKIDNIREHVLITVYAYINLSEIYLGMNSYENIREYLIEIEKYKVYFNEDDYRDIDIVKNIIDAEICIKEGKLVEAKEKLEYASKLLIEDYNTFLIDKEIMYSIAYAKFSKANGDYDGAIEILEKSIEESIERNDMYNRRRMIEIVIEMAEGEGDIKLKDEYLEYLSEWHIYNESIIYRDYTYYIMESVENNNTLKREKEKKISAYRLLIVGVIIFYISYRIIYRKIKKMKYINSHDSLTSVYNRLQFDKDYKLLLNKNIKFAVIIIDVDNFKAINDNYGHCFGDLVLVNICRSIKGILYEDCSIYRYGGEEFIILVKYKIKSESIILAENIRKSIKRIVWENGLSTTISLGIATSEDEVGNVLEQADKNLYKAKKTGKDKTIFKI